MRVNLFVFVALFLLLVQTAQVSFGGGTTALQANVAVACPFYLGENALSVYTIGNSITLNYTVHTQAQCSISDLVGNFVLEYSSNNVQVQFNSINAIATLTPVTYNLPTINSMTLSPNNYRAITSFSTFGSSNESTRTFLLVSPVNIVVMDFTVSPGSVSMGSPLTFTANILNDGELASGQIGVNIVVTGPQSVTTSESASALSPGQSEVLTFVLSGVTGAAGTYSADFFATFISSNIVMQSNTRSTTYSVAQPPVPSHGAPPTSGTAIISIPRLSFTEVPFYSSLLLGSAGTSHLGLKNTATVPITVTLTIPMEFRSILGLSAYSVYLVPNESLLVQLFFDAGGLDVAGTYVVPVNIGVKTLNGTSVNSTQYFTYLVSESSYNVSLYSQIQVMQNNVTVTTSLMGARNTSLTNATLVTMLPSSVVSSSSQIKTYGLPATITSGDSGLQINWLIPYLPPGKTITLSYTISNPKNVGLLEFVQNLITVPSAPTSASILRVVSIQTPTFYSNAINKVTVGVLYTGTLQQSVKFMLTTTGIAEVLNPVQFVNASPNQLLLQTFNVRTRDVTGTILLNLGIDTPGASVNYTLPVIVLQNTGAATTTTPQVIIPEGQVMKYVLVVLGVAAAGVAAGFMRGIRRKSKYNAERAKELIRIREQIKRSDEHA